MKLTLGCTTRPYNDLPFAQACQHIAAAGYTDVALFRNAVEPDSSEKLISSARQIAQDAGLNPSMLLGRTYLELGPEGALSQYRRVIDNAATLGADWLLDTGVSSPELYDAYWALMQRAAPYAASSGVQITLKPHGGITLTKADLVSAFQRVNHPAFGICYDPGNIIYYTAGQERPETDISSVAPLVTTGIIKDCIVRQGEPDVMITPGTGWVDWHQVLSSLTEGGFRGPLYVECVGGKALDEIDENVRQTLSLIQDILSRMPD
jgi:sugar phosphate isomerase/epimerase